MNKLQKTCIHTNVLSCIDNQVKFVKRVYLIHNSKEQPKIKTNYINMSGWSKIGTTVDKHKIFTNQTIIEETEIWANNKHLASNYNVTSSSEADNNEIELKYKFINNFTSTPVMVDKEQLIDSKSALSLFKHMCNYYLDMVADADIYNLDFNCSKFKQDIKFDSNNELLYARAITSVGRVILAVEKL